MYKDRNELHGLGHRRLHEKVGADTVGGIQAEEDDLFRVAAAIFECPIETHG